MWLPCRISKKFDQRPVLFIRVLLPSSSVALTCFLMPPLKGWKAKQVKNFSGAKKAIETGLKRIADTLSPCKTLSKKAWAAASDEEHDKENQVRVPAC